MRIVLELILLTICFAMIANAQTATPTPTSTPVRDGEIVRISTNLIQIDVGVTDADGKPITDLRSDEVEIFENGQKQSITNFSFVGSVRSADKKPAKKVDGVPEPPVELRPEQVRRTIALVVDDLSLSFESAYQTRRALKKYVDEQMQDGDLVAIIRTGAGIGALQQFTSNKLQLYAAIERVKWNPKGVGRFGSFDPIEPTGKEIARRMGDRLVTLEQITEEREFLQSGSDFRESVFTAGTLGALKFIVRGMGELPGRKSVMLFSDGLRIFNRIEGGTQSASRILDFLKELVDDANRKSVVFYALDARGLVYSGFTAADNVTDPFTQGDNQQISIQQRLSERNSELFDSQQGLHYIAKSTGGFAYVNQNDLAGGVQKVLDDQSYYLVGYQPTGENFDAAERRLNKLEVRVKRDGVRVRHRTGFFVGDAKSPGLRVDLNYPTKIMRALTSPFSVNEIGVRLNALFGYTTKRGPFVHSFLHFDADDLEFRPLPNGDLMATFEILAISYGDNGQPIQKYNAQGSSTIRPFQLEAIRREGLAYSFVFPIKKPGAYQMRVALLDVIRGKVGSANQFVEVPDIKRSGITLSGIVLENSLPSSDDPGRSSYASPDQSSVVSDPIYSTARRQFRRGSRLRFGAEVFNVKDRKGPITSQIRLFHDQKLIFEGKENVITQNQEPGGDVNITEMIELGKGLDPGDYVLQIVVADPTEKRRSRYATQYIQFEVID